MSSSLEGSTTGTCGHFIEKHFHQRLVDTISITRALDINNAGPQRPP